MPHMDFYTDEHILKAVNFHASSNYILSLKIERMIAEIKKTAKIKFHVLGWGWRKQGCYYNDISKVNELVQ